MLTRGQPDQTYCELRPGPKTSQYSRESFCASAISVLVIFLVSFFLHIWQAPRAVRRQY